MTKEEEIKGALHALLLAINGLETCDSRGAVELARDALMRFKNDTIGSYFTTNEELSQLDHVFTESGWDDQGFRWTREDLDDPDEPDDIFVVELDPSNPHAFTIL